MFRFYVYIEYDDFTCSNAFPYGGTGKHCDHKTNTEEDESLLKAYVVNRCHDACVPNECYGDSKSKYNCRRCKTTERRVNYFNTISKTELICDENYEDEQLLPEGTVANPVLDCNHFEVLKMPSYLMPTYDPDVPNWRCIATSPLINFYTVNQVTSIMYDGSDLGSHGFGSFRCIGGCEKYPYLPHYSKICQTTFLPMRISVTQDTFTCCRYNPVIPGGDCLLSCFEEPGHF